jgi:hypothetical protein
MASPGSRTRTLIIYKELESKVKNKVKEKKLAFLAKKS